MKKESLKYFSKHFPPVLHNCTLTCKEIWCYFYKKGWRKFVLAKRFSAKATNIKCNSDILSGIEDGMFWLADDQLGTASSQRVQVERKVISYQWNNLMYFCSKWMLNRLEDNIFYRIGVLMWTQILCDVWYRLAVIVIPTFCRFLLCPHWRHSDYPASAARP